MRNRQKSLERLLAVKTQLHRLEEAKLGEIQRQKQIVVEERQAMFNLLGDEKKTDGFILGLACRHIARTDNSERDLDAAETEQKQALLKRSAQKRALEKIVKEAADAADRDSERRTLLDIGEKLGQKLGQKLGEQLAIEPPTSLP